MTMRYINRLLHYNRFGVRATVETGMSVFLIVGPKCMLAALHAVSW